MAVLHLRLLGGFALTLDEAPLRLPDRRARGLLAIMSLADGPVSRSRLAGLLEADTGGAGGRAAVRQALFVIRRATGDLDPVAGSGEMLTLRADRLWTDVGTLVAALRAGPPEAVEPVLALYSGELLHGMRSPSEAFEAWLRDARAQLDERTVTALLAAARRKMTANNPEQALAFARQALTIDPLCEAADRAAMSALIVMKRPEGARRQLDRCRNRLRNELGTGPDPRTLAIMTGRPASDQRRRLDALRLQVSAGVWAGYREQHLAGTLRDLLLVELSRAGHPVVADAGGEGWMELQVRVARQPRRRLLALARLVDPNAAQICWAERFEALESTAFVPVSGLHARIAGAIGSPTYGRLADASVVRLRARRPDELSPLELCVLADRALEPGDGASLTRTRALLDRALKVDPTCALAWTELACLELRCSAFGLQEPTTAAERVYSHAVAALRLSPSDADANLYFSIAAAQLGEVRTAEKALNAALTSGRSNVDLCCSLGWEYAMQGRPTRAAPFFTHARALDPASPLRFSLAHGFFAFAQGRYEDALASFGRTPTRWRYVPQYYASSAAGHLGRQDTVERIGRSIGGFSQLPPPASVFRGAGGFHSGALDQLLDGLRKAGIPTG